MAACYQGETRIIEETVLVDISGLVRGKILIDEQRMMAELVKHIF